MLKGKKTVSVSDDLARMLDDEARHVYAAHGVEVSRAQIVTGIVKAELERRIKERTSREGAKKGGR